MLLPTKAKAPAAPAVVALLTVLLSSGTASCQKPDDLQRPAPPRRGTADARVVFVTGTVTITPASGAPWNAAVDTDLIAADRIEAAAKGSVVVVLRNGHLVRLDDTGAIAVNELLLFGAPPSSVSPAVQLADLLDPNETVPVNAVAERAAAWRAMKRVGDDRSKSAEEETPKKVKRAITESQKADADLREGEGVTGGVAAEEIVPPPPPPPPAPQGSASSSSSSSPSSSPSSPASVPVPGSPRGGDAAASEVGGRWAHGTTPVRLPPSLAALVPELRVCAEASGARDGVTVELWIEVKEGSVLRVRFSGGLPSACARTLLPKTLDVTAPKATASWLIVPLLPTNLAPAR